MACTNPNGLVGVVVDISTNPMVRGSDVFVTTQVQFAFESPRGYQGPPYSFQSFVGATGYFPADPVTQLPFVAATGSLVSADLGQVKFSIPAAASVNLQVGDELSWEQNFVDARGTTIIVFNALNVVDQLF